MKYICYYHKSDFDGKCAGAIVKRKYPDCTMIGWDYGDPVDVEAMDLDTTVFCVDISFPIGVMQEARRRAYTLVWIDHHITAIEAAQTHDFHPLGIRQTGIGACELTWRYVYSYDKNKTPRAVHLLALYDVWDHSDPDVLPFQYGMRAVEDASPDNTLFWEDLFRHNLFVDLAIEQGHTIYDYEKLQNAHKCKSLYFETEFIDKAGNAYLVIAANVGCNNSQFFDAFYDPERHALMVSFVRRNTQWNFSLYSTRKDIHCGEIAKQFGGGGHPGAAGFSLIAHSNVPLLDW